MIGAMFRKLFHKDETLPDLLSADAFHAPINAILDERLKTLGLERTKPGTWAKADCRLGRPMVEIRHYKGKQSAPVWGYSLNYVPHLTGEGRRVAWHRTQKSARLDVFPFDEQHALPTLSRFATADAHEHAAARILGDACDRAAKFFERYRSLNDLLPLFDRLEADKGEGLSYWNYTSLPLAHAFTLNAVGKSTPARDRLDQYMQRMNVAGKARDDLLQRFAAAAHIGTEL